MYNWIAAASSTVVFPMGARSGSCAHYGEGECDACECDDKDEGGTEDEGE